MINLKLGTVFNIIDNIIRWSFLFVLSRSMTKYLLQCTFWINFTVLILDLITGMCICLYYVFILAISSLNAIKKKVLTRTISLHRIYYKCIHWFIIETRGHTHVWPFYVPVFLRKQDIKKHIFMNFYIVLTLI